MPHDHTIREQAAAWAVRTGDPDFADWEAFTAWLEEEPAHARAYDEVSAAVADAAQALVGAGAPANDDVLEAAPVRAHPRWLAGAIAASLALLAVVGFWQPWSSGFKTYVTAPGETRTIALERGGSIALAGGTRLQLDRRDPRNARLEEGQALFTIHHDDARPFRLAVGDATLVDVGTIFDVRHEAGSLRVAVAEGAVQFNPDRQDVRIDPGQVLASDGRRYTLAAIAPGEVGEWREGRLTFAAAPLADVAADLTRATGTRFSVAPGAAGRTVSGSILVAPLRQDPQALGPLLDVSVRRTEDGWTLGAP